uniref:Ribonuclease H2 subunit B n=1 Tax=Clastoptera arizonana TaxID=38151 RepID=A0A1B6DRY5_9HEMI
MPRIKASPKKCVKSNNPSQSGNTWLFLVKGEALEVPEGYAGTGTPDIVQLRHPQTGAPAMFLFSPGDGLVQEVLTFSENKRSWFLEESIKQDGKMHLSTPIDPIFLVLPYLRKISSYASPLDQIVQDDEFPDTERLLSCSGLKLLPQVADKKGDEDVNAYKYNEEKTLTWLQKKTECVAEMLKQKGIHVSGGNAVSASFVKSNNDSTENYLKYAHGIVSEYLPDDLSARLSRHLGLPTENELSGNKRKQLTNTNTNSDNKRTKLETSALPSEEPIKNGALDLSKPEKITPKTSSKEKARSKAATGSKNITAFFKKK